MTADGQLADGQHWSHIYTYIYIYVFLGSHVSFFLCFVFLGFKFVYF